MAYDVGDVALFRLTVAPFDGTTAATAVVRAPDGTETPATPATTDGGATWTLQVPLTAAGTWYVGWTVTGTGAGTQWDSTDADPVPPPTDGQRRVRLLISDTDPANRLFSTSEVNDFLAMNSDNVRRAAAQALETIAGNEAMVSKKITTQDLSTDGPAVAKELRELAKSLRAQADSEDDQADEGAFEIVEYTPYPCRPELSGWY